MERRDPSGDSDATLKRHSYSRLVNKGERLLGSCTSVSGGDRPSRRRSLRSLELGSCVLIKANRFSNLGSETLCEKPTMDNSNSQKFPRDNFMGQRQMPAFFWLKTLFFYRIHTGYYRLLWLASTLVQLAEILILLFSLADLYE